MAAICSKVAIASILVEFRFCWYGGVVQCFVLFQVEHSSELVPSLIEFQLNMLSYCSSIPAVPWVDI